MTALDEADFFHTITSQKSFDEKFESLHGYALNLGFEDIFYASLINVDVSARFNRENVRERRAGCSEWAEIYAEEGYSRVDWALEHAIWSHLPFRLNDAPDNLTEKQEKFLRHASERKRHNGFSLPIRGPFGLVGGFSANGAEKRPSDYQIAKVLSAAQLFDLTVRANQAQELSQKYELTEREIELLQLLVNGRSMAEIAHFVGASDQWIRRSFLNMRRKFSVQTNNQLIYRALALQVI